ncbi:MAG TPA: KamA family radical SAM protein [Polyangiaceae bacterium]|jgi:lysine 2,3-aminomutase|nr:KamA family radical SAM protein [Polyangiaceae bacterium]
MRTLAIVITSASPSHAAPSTPSTKSKPRRRPSDWQWQLQHSVRTAARLSEVFRLSPDELHGALAAERDGFPISITPYYLSLADPSDPACPIRRQVVPHALEAREVPGDLRDPLGEEAHEVAPDLVQRYPDRALLFATDRCAVYCRFCTRSRLVGAGGGARSLDRLAPAFAYLRAHPEVRDVIVSGGDPLALATDRIVALVRTLRGIGSIETIRLATRVPVALPQRITTELVRALRPFHPLWVMTHFNHPKELTDASRRACRRLADAGCPVMNHTVLLRGVNDDSATLATLFRGLVKERVRPYYLLQADPVRGTGHLRTPLSTGLRIMAELQGRLSGIALPKFIVDTPGGLGKVPVSPDYVIERGEGRVRFRTHRGVEVDYLDPPD